MATVQVRPFENRTDFPRVIDLWNRSLPSDPVSAEVFRQKVLLDENFDRHGCLVAERAGELVGFCLALTRKFPYGSRGLELHKGWLSMLFVHPEHRRQGIGSALLAGALAYLEDAGREVCAMGYSPLYFIPGPDEATHREAIAFLQARGFAIKDEAIALAGELRSVVVPKEFADTQRALEASGFRFIPYDDRYTIPALAFVERVAPGGWPVSLRQTLSRGKPAEEVVLCVRDDAVVGYAQVNSPLYDPPHGNPERFGPFAVDPELRSRGIGSVLFFVIVDRLRARGFQYVWLAWAHGDNVRFYQRCGLQITRRHVLLERSL